MSEKTYLMAIFLIWSGISCAMFYFGGANLESAKKILGVTIICAVLLLIKFLVKKEIL